MHLKKTLTTIIISILPLGQSFGAVDPATAMFVANTAVKLFSRPGPDVSLEILKSNRELLTGLHGRLSGIEMGLAEALVQISGLHHKMFVENLNAQVYALGKEITAIGLTYLDKLEEYHLNKKTWQNHPKNLQQLDQEFREYLDRERTRLSNKVGDLTKRENSYSVNSLSIITGALIEISMQIEFSQLVFRTEGGIKVSTRKYEGLLNNILDPDKVDSLSRLILDHEKLVYSGEFFKRKMTTKDLTKEWAATALEGTYGERCRTLRVSYYETVMVGKYINVNPPKDSDRSPYQYVETPTKVKKWRDSESVKIGVDIKRVMSLSGTPIYTSSMFTKKLSDNPSHCLRVDKKSEIEAFRAQFSKEVTQFIFQSKILSQLISMQKSAQDVLRRIRMVKDGNLQSIVAHDFYSIKDGSFDNILIELNNANYHEMLSKSQSNISDMKYNREDMQRLMEEQDKHLRSTFQAAIDAAKWNKTLSYIKGVAMAYNVHHWLDKNVSQEDIIELQQKLRDAKSSIQQDIGREPASTFKSIASIIDNLSGVASFWGHAFQGPENFKKFSNDAFEMAKSIPLGQTVEYNLVMQGNKYIGLSLSSEPQLKSPGVKADKTVKIKGLGVLTSEANEFQKYLEKNH